MGHRGPKTSEIEVESDIFSGKQFGESLWLGKQTKRDIEIPVTVVFADPKSRSGQEERKQLIEL